MSWITLILGFAFGTLLQVARLNRFNTISGLAMRENYTVAKAIAASIGVGIIVIALEVGLGMATFHVKPFLVVGIVLGGLLFGSGMAILGYCPGTLPVSLGEGSLDALFGIVGGIVGGVVFTAVQPSVANLFGPNLGSVSFLSLAGIGSFAYYAIAIIVGVAFIIIAFFLQGKVRTMDYKWLIAGSGLAILNAIVFLPSVANRIIGASTAYPYAGDMITSSTGNTYFSAIETPGRWELLFLTGAFLSGLVISLLRKEFKLQLMHSNWTRFKGESSAKRMVWASLGGFVLIIGARMAGGCTSGHILSGGMQLAISSLVFAIFVFSGLLLTGWLFYRKSIR